MATPRGSLVIQATRHGLIGVHGYAPDGAPPPPPKEERLIRRVVAAHQGGTSAPEIAADITADTGYISVAEVRAIIAEHAPQPAEPKPRATGGRSYDLAGLAEMYQRGDRIADIQAVMGIGRTTVHRLLKAAGIPLRGAGKRRPA
ncbi:hypothetical protein [Amycolatopsis echigonensis]|uniref:Uncharacterized protein n=1 Tax=Amycolatopsis echigonensis TaxID=2576905 RepID=A0A8E1W2H1_9PSEU|nr:hypothetical protein [Amycolatopsis echigonensis]MBB2502929.1 hypothetical protein [Amycolatopsis echigonensis]